jgi:ribonucleoside-diphosphate reductase alpha chain
MRVKKRDNTLVPVRFDEITDRITSLSEDLDKSVIDPARITIEVVEKIQDCMSTSLIDSFTAGICHVKYMDHPDFNTLAGRLIISDHHKNISIEANMKYSKVCKILYNNTDQLGEHSPLISDELYELSQEHAELIDGMIDDERDFKLDYFGFKTLYNSYLLKVAGKVIETPQHLFMRVALGIWGRIKTEDGTLYEPDFKLVKETYDLLSNKYFTHATPSLFNAGTRKPQFFSCFLLGMDDSIDSIFKVLSDTAKISKWSGGIGIHISDIRSNNAYVRGTGGRSDGIVPMLKVYNDTARYINQGGRRPGSIAMYLEPWHADVKDFLKCKLQHGEETKRAKDLFYAMWIPDLFMKRVKNNETWSLMCPSKCPGLDNLYGEEFEKAYVEYEKAGRVVEEINARDLFNQIIASQLETGTPYMCYKDAANKKSNQKNVGVIKSSNLCVAPETRIMTKNGYTKIVELKDKEVEVWNGEQWSNTTVKQTGENQKIIKVVLSNGSIINCTEYHKFPIETSDSYGKTDIKSIEAKDLKKDMKLIKHDLPVIKEGGLDMKYAYTQGMFSADGTYSYPKYGPQEKEAKITLYGKKKDLIPFLDIRTSSYKETANETINVMLPYDIEEKFKVPVNYSLDTKLKWFAGLCDGDGTVALNSIQITSIEYDFLFDTLLMLQTIGIHSKVTKNRDACKQIYPDGKGGQKEYDRKDTYRLLVSASETQKLLILGFKTNRLVIEDKEYKSKSGLRYITIVSIEDEGRIDDTFCFTEPLRNMGMFEGILTMNCAEIFEYSDTNKYACCVLASIVLPTYVVDGVFDHRKLAEVVKVATNNLNRVIDINYYPVKETMTSNMSERPIGIGIQGLADVFFKMGLPYDSPEALKLDKEIHETIYFSSLSASMELSKKYGPYETFKGSPISKGQFQFDLWKEYPTTKENSITVSHNGRHDWAKLKKDIKKHGVRNSLTTADMPTASTSQIMGSASESFEPITTNCGVRRTTAGEFICLNKFLAADLIKHGLWNENIRNILLNTRGSIQNIEGIPQNLKDIYKTVWEIKQRVLIDHSAERGQYIDQGQSLNLYFEDGNYDILTKAHLYGWAKGLKTGSYYIRSKPSSNSASFTSKSNNLSIKNKSDGSENGDDEEEVDDDCLMCGS